MDREQWHDTRDFLARLLDQPPARRPSMIEERCRTDPAFLERLQWLLGGSSDADACLDDLAVRAGLARADRLRAGSGSEARRATRDALRTTGLEPATESRRPVDGPGGEGPREETPGLEQEVRFCTTRDGVRLAYASVGDGPSLVKAANWLSHLEFDARSPVWRHWLRELSRDHRLIRYDERGCGLSDWDVEFSFEGWVRDLETVVEAAGAERFALLGISQGGPVAIEYAWRNPSRVSHLILYGTYGRGWAKRAASEREREELEAHLTLTATGWGKNNPAYRQLFTSLFIPEGTPEQANWFNELQRISTSPENAVRFQRLFAETDVADRLTELEVPTLVLHARHDGRVPFEAGRALAARIPGARFVSLDSRNHLLLEHEPAWATFLYEVRRFLGVDAATAAPGAGSGGERGSASRVESITRYGDPHERLHRAFGDRFALEEELARGGMAVVYLAWDRKHERRVAIKVLDPGLGAEAGPRRFEREIRLTSRLQHPHILPLLDSGRVDDVLFFVTPYIAGASLRHLLHEAGALPVARAVRIARDISEALAYAHSAGVVHRDIKPENVLLSEGAALVSDFGIARAAELEGTRLTAQGSVVGTLRYISPEQLRSGGTEVGDRADVYALGCLLYEMLTGEAPFDGPAPELIRQHLSAEPRPPRELRPEVPPALEATVLASLRKEPRERPSAAELVGRFESVGHLAGRGRTPEPTEAAAVAGRGGGGRRWLRVAIGIGLALAASVGAWRACGAQQADSVRATGDTLPVYRGAEIEVRVARSETPLGRLPFGVGLADRAELQEARRGASLEEALRFVPGVFVQNRRNAALGDRVTARGVGARAQFGVRGIRVLADGIPLTLPDGQTTLTNLDLASAGRLEVIRGPASALYGNAAGGVLSYRTERPPATGARIEPLVLGGSHGFLEGRVKAAGRAGEVGYVGSFGYARADGFREHSESEIVRGNVVVSGPLGAGRVRGLLNLYRTPFAENPSSLSLEDATERPRLAREAVLQAGLGEEATQGQAGLGLDTPLGDDGRLRVTAWGLRRDLWNPIPGRIIGIDRWAGGVRSELSGAFHTAGTDAGTGVALRWTGGADLELQRDDRVEWENLGVADPGEDAREGDRLLDQRERVLGLGPFLELEAALGPRWVVLAAGRLDLYRFEAEDRFLTDGDDSGDRTLSRLSPSLGLVFDAAPGLHLYGNVSTAFQTPTTSELSNDPDGAGGFNESLEPERIWSVEVGGRGTVAGARLGYEASAFRASVEDALIPFEGETGEVFFRNAGRVERAGVEGSLGWRASEALELRLAGTLQRLRFDTFVTEAGDFSGNDEPGVPTRWLTIGAVHTTPFGLRSQADLRWVDAYAVDDANTAYNPSWRVVDLRISLDRRDRGWPLRLFLGVDNLLDERYNASVVPNAFGGRYYEPAPGIELYGGAGLPLGPGGAGS